jgi:lysophospholipase L1-like esterase
MHEVVCLGASIVRGQVSFNFVKLLSQRMEKDGFRFVNAGVPGDLAYNVLGRLDAVIARQPDCVVILVGTNDVTATLMPGMAKWSRLLTRKLPQTPSAEWYRDNMLQVVRLLKEKTPARIALASIPILGEDLTSLPNERVRAYNALLEEITVQEQVAYLPVHERQAESLKGVQQTPGRPYQAGVMLSIKLLVRHFLLRQSFDHISGKNGFLLVTDGIHMNSRGAAIIADEVESFIRAGA